MRNATVTTIAPTGTISIIAGCSSGIEPLFALSYVRANVWTTTAWSRSTPYFEQVAARARLLQRRAHEEDRRGGLRAPRRRRARRRAAGVRHRARHHARVAHQAAGGLPEEHRQRRLQDRQLPQRGHPRRRREGLPPGLPHRLQGRHHLPRRLPRRAGAQHRRGQEEARARAPGRGPASPPLRPGRARSCSPARPSEMDTGCGKLFVTINDDEFGAREVFANMGKAGGCASSDTEALGRLISLALRYGAPPEKIVKQLKGIRCHVPLRLRAQPTSPAPTPSARRSSGATWPAPPPRAERRRRSRSSRWSIAAGRVPGLRRRHRARGRLHGVQRSGVRLLQVQLSGCAVSST